MNRIAVAVAVVLTVLFSSHVHAQHRVLLDRSCLERGTVSSWQDALFLLDGQPIVESVKAPEDLFLVSEVALGVALRPRTSCFLIECFAGEACRTLPVEILFVVEVENGASFGAVAESRGSVLIEESVHPTDPSLLWLTYGVPPQKAQELVSLSDVISAFVVPPPDHPSTPGAVTPPTPAVVGRTQRFRVEVRYFSNGGTALGKPIELGRDSTSFWFFDRSNTELLVKVLDGCAINGHHWVFAAGLTDRGVSLAITPLDPERELFQVGSARGYGSPEGTAFEPILDTTAFLCE